MTNVFRTYLRRCMTVALTVLAITFAVPCAAQSYIGFSLGGHSPLTMDTVRIAKTLPGYGGELGFVYEWHMEHLIIQTGLQYALLCPRKATESQTIEQPMIDTRGMPFTYRGTIDQRRDVLRMGQVSIPIYAGAVWNGLYGIAGVKLVLNAHSSASQNAIIRLVGDYQDRYYEWFENMPNHGYFDDMPIQTNHSISLNLLDVRVGGEIGYAFYLPSTFDYSRTPMMRIGAFAEYGVLDIRTSQLKKSTTPYSQPDYTQFMSVEMTHVYASQEAAKSAANMFTCGIRLTFLFPVSEVPQKHYNCNCYGKFKK